MAVSINEVYNNFYTQNDSSVKTSALEKKLNGSGMENATDEELLDACKEFEAYLIEQVLKEVKESIPKSEEEDNKYTEYFGDMMLQEYASLLTDRGDLGIAQTLYESMKNNINAVKIKNTEVTTEAQEVAGAAQKIDM